MNTVFEQQIKHPERLFINSCTALISEFDNERLNIFSDLCLRIILLTSTIIAYLTIIPMLIVSENTITFCTDISNLIDQLERDLGPLMLIPSIPLSILLISLVCFAVLFNVFIVIAPVVFFKETLLLPVQISCITESIELAMWALSFYEEEVQRPLLIENLNISGSFSEPIKGDHPLISWRPIETPRLFDYIKSSLPKKNPIKIIEACAVNLLPLNGLYNPNGSATMSKTNEGALVLRFNRRTYAERLCVALNASGIPALYQSINDENDRDAVARLIFNEPEDMGKFLTRFTTLSEKQILEEFPFVILPNRKEASEEPYRINPKKVQEKSFIDTVGLSTLSLLPYVKGTRISVLFKEGLKLLWNSEIFPNVFYDLLEKQGFKSIKKDGCLLEFDPTDTARFLIEFLEFTRSEIGLFFNNPLHPVVQAIEKLYPIKNFILEEKRLPIKDYKFNPIYLKTREIPPLPPEAEGYTEQNLLTLFEALTPHFSIEDGTTEELLSGLNAIIRQSSNSAKQRLELSHIAYLLSTVDPVGEQKEHFQSRYISTLALAGRTCGTGKKSGSSSVYTQVVQNTNNPYYAQEDKDPSLSDGDKLIANQILAFLEKKRLEIFEKLINPIDRGRQSVHTRSYYLRLAGAAIGHPEGDLLSEEIDEHEGMAKKQNKPLPEFIEDFYKEYTIEKMVLAIKEELDKQGSVETLERIDRKKQLNRESNLQATSEQRKTQIAQEIAEIDELLRATISQQDFNNFLERHVGDDLSKAYKARGYDESAEPTGEGYSISYIESTLKELGLICLKGIH